MASVNFIYRGSKAQGNLTIRLKHKNIDYRISSEIVSFRKYWFKTNGTKRRLQELSYLEADAKKHKIYLEKIKDDLLQKFTEDYNKGVPISKEWLKSAITEIIGIVSDTKDIEKAQQELQRIETEKKEKQKDIYNKNLVTTAIKRVIEIEYFDNLHTARIYNQLLNKIHDYEKAKRTKLKTKEVTQDFIYLFTAFMINDLKHQNATALKHCKSLVHAVRYQKKAFPDIVEVSQSINDIKYKRLNKFDRKKRRSEIITNLSFEELDKINNTDVPVELLDAKKCILFGSETGLRVSDFNKLTEENIKQIDDLEFWYFWNKKTGTDVFIPINNRIKKYIKLYGMPKTNYKTNDDVILNRDIKKVCEIAEINEIIQGRKSTTIELNGKKERRTISGEFKKYELVTCHDLRRSFATNYIDILGAEDVRKITGHTNDKQLFEYINQQQNETERLKKMLKKMNTKQ